MTALKPIENSRVRGIAAEAYPSNLICAHPNCTEPVQLRPKTGEPTVHHVFASSKIKSRSYFVAIEVSASEFAESKWMWKFPLAKDMANDKDAVHIIVPHAVGLCGSGTTGHHGDVEEHRGWIKFEEGVYVWYDREVVAPEHDGATGYETWNKVGPLNPQPGSRDGKTKRGPNRRTSGKPRARHVYPVNVPKDEQENGVELMDEYVQILREKWGPDLGWSENVSAYYPIITALAKAVTGA